MYGCLFLSFSFLYDTFTFTFTYAYAAYAYATVIVLVRNPVPPHSAFASERLMALRRLVAGRALDFEQELCSICICVSQEKVEIHFIVAFSINSDE